MPAPPLYTKRQQRMANALLHAYRTGGPIIRITPQQRAFLIKHGIAYVNNHAQLILNVTKFLQHSYVVSPTTYDQLTDPEYRQRLSAERRGFSSLEAYQNRQSVPMSDAKKKAKRDPYRGTRPKILAQPPDITEDILFLEPPIPIHRKETTHNEKIDET